MPVCEVTDLTYSSFAHSTGGNGRMTAVDAGGAGVLSRAWKLSRLRVDADIEPSKAPGALYTGEIDAPSLLRREPGHQVTICDEMWQSGCRLLGSN